MTFKVCQKLFYKILEITRVGEEHTYRRIECDFHDIDGLIDQFAKTLRIHFELVPITFGAVRRFFVEIVILKGYDGQSECEQSL